MHTAQVNVEMKEPEVMQLSQEEQEATKGMPDVIFWTSEENTAKRFFAEEQDAIDLMFKTAQDENKKRTPKRANDLQELLQRYPGIINLRYHGGDPVLILAVRNSKIEMVQALITAGADLDQKNRDGNTALVYAIKKTHWRDLEEHFFPIVGILLEEVNSEILADLKISMNRNNEIKRKIAPMLIVAGADPNLQNSAGNTPLILAADNQDYDMVKMLISAGADKDIRDNQNKTALDFAIELGFKERYLAAVKAGEKLRRLDLLKIRKQLEEYIIRDLANIVMEYYQSPIPQDSEKTKCCIIQ